MNHLLLLCAAIFILVGCQQNPDTQTRFSQIITLDSVWSGHLQTFKTIRVYLPPNYQNETRTYPTIYLHDGQNLFYDSTSFVGEWGVDETLDSLYETDGISVIAVGIDHGNERRISEFSMRDSKYGEASGTAYLNFVKLELKPKIDSMYRTNPGSSTTMMLGSSLGGLISHYAFFENPDVFGRVGIFSPSYWFDTLSLSLATTTRLPESSRVYVYGGGEEGSRMVELIRVFESNFIHDTTQAVQLKVSVNQSGRHQEMFWRNEFPHAIVWLLKGN